MVKKKSNEEIREEVSRGLTRVDCGVTGTTLCTPCWNARQAAEQQQHEESMQRAERYWQIRRASRERMNR